MYLHMLLILLVIFIYVQLSTFLSSGSTTFSIFYLFIYLIICRPGPPAINSLNFCLSGNFSLIFLNVNFAGDRISGWQSHLSAFWTWDTSAFWTLKFPVKHRLLNLLKIFCKWSVDSLLTAFKIRVLSGFQQFWYVCLWIPLTLLLLLLFL